MHIHIGNILPGLSIVEDSQVVPVQELATCCLFACVCDTGVKELHDGESISKQQGLLCLGFKAALDTLVWVFFYGTTARQTGYCPDKLRP